MASIKHLLHINAPGEKVYEALTTLNGLSNWWTLQVSGETQVGGILQFMFGKDGFDMKIDSLKPDDKVEWECVAGPDDWIGTTINFKLDSNDGKTRLRFEHAGWKEDNDFFAGCSFSWGRYMESLRQLCQTGIGAPFGSVQYQQ